MKLHEYLKQFERLDPDLEVGIGFDDSFSSLDNIQLEYVNGNSLNNYTSSEKSCNQSNHFDTKVLILAQIYSD